MRDCSGNQLIGTQGELGMYRIFQREKQYFKVTAFYALSLSKYHMKCHIHESFERCHRDISLQMMEEIWDMQ